MAYCDADHANDKLDRKSITGVMVLLNGNVISWSAKKQSIVAGSTCEAEYVAMYTAVQHILFLRNELTNMGISVEDNSKILSDNNAARRIHYMIVPNTLIPSSI
ncbi:MAG TPA: Ty1/Copia family ribonuclease HI [Bacteroidia bacterium]|nr:Ty1/Copia family ribonuclease HI [Bacteroidia bacterium]